MLLVGVLIVFPLIAAALVVASPDAERRDRRVRVSSYALGALTIVLALLYAHAGPQFFSLPDSLALLLDRLIAAGGVLLSLGLLYLCRRIRPRESYIPALILIQTGLILAAELSPAAPAVAHPLYLDSFSILLALIVGVVGGLTCIHAIHYMQDYHAQKHNREDETHAEGCSDRRTAFFFVLFVFLAAMLGICFSNNLMWLFFFWEATTFCSFWLIAYACNEEAIRNAYRALGLNLVGGVCFAAAMLWLARGPGLHTWELDALIAGGSAAALIPAALIAVAGLAKSAQMPFSSWLLGAMVAPTPVSALLHSSTMVKAGVFILVKLAPVFHATVPGLLLSLIGGATFVATSLAAVSQRNAKRVLAYSTVANLGLIVMCAGLGTTETLWAAILLILFHAVAKALLFLGVGTTEHLIGSRDIEDMEGLAYRRPAIAAALAIGMLGMYLAPFGLLLAKYSSLKAFLSVDVLPGGGVVLATLLAFGSAPILFFWTKWLGKLVALPTRDFAAELSLPRDEGTALLALAVITYVACALFPMADWAFVHPYTSALVSSGLIPAGDDRIPWETVAMMTLMLGGLFLLPLTFWLWPPPRTLASGYLSGANLEGSASYRGAAGAAREVSIRGYYLAGFFDEGRLTLAGTATAAALLAALFAGVWL